MDFKDYQGQRLRMANINKKQYLGKRGSRNLDRSIVTEYKQSNDYKISNSHEMAMNSFKNNTNTSAGSGVHIRVKSSQS